MIAALVLHLLPLLRFDRNLAAPVVQRECVLPSNVECGHSTACSLPDEQPLAFLEVVVWIPFR